MKSQFVSVPVFLLTTQILRVASKDTGTYVGAPPKGLRHHRFNGHCNTIQKMTDPRTFRAGFTLLP